MCITGTDEEIAEAFKLLVDQLKAKHAASEVVIQSILPREDAEGIYLQRIQHINELISKMNTTYEYHYLDLASHFQDSNTKRVKANLYLDDKIHLSKDGYQLWHDLLDPLLKNLTETN